MATATTTALALGACGQINKDLGTAGMSPGGIECAGKFTMSIVGAAGFGGGSGSISGDCGPGAYIRQGKPGAGGAVTP